MRIQFDVCGDSGEFTANVINKIIPTFRFDVHGYDIFFIKEGESKKVFCTSFEIIG